MNDDRPTVHDYDADDGWYKDGGIEHCPHCETPFSPNGGYMGAVYDQRGQEFETLYNTDAKKGPYFCEECFEELERNRRTNENQSIEEFA